jgi:transitional endoplasmic reticulum ATPase
MKPLLYNNYKISDNLYINKREEKIFFTEIYSLSNGRFLYLFLNIKPEEVIDFNAELNIIKINISGEEYIGVITDSFSGDKIYEISEKLTKIRGLDSVAGMKELKNLLITEVIEPLRNPEKFKRFKISIPNGILLFGPPGCGKTFIVKKLSEELGYSFVELNPSSVATPYIHGAVGNIGKVFEMAKLQSPTIIFIDEIEGLLPKREDLSSSADTKKEEINEFLLQLNNSSENNILVVGATNRPEMIDSAILRSGRMDKRIYVSPPDFESRKELFKISLIGRPFSKNIDFNKLAKETENFVSSDIALITNQAARMTLQKNEDSITEENILKAIRNTTPSITKEQIEYFEQFKNIERW